MADVTDETLADDELQRPSLPEAELPEDDAEQLETSEPKSQAQPMPGWFKFALILVPMMLAGVGYGGYQYLTGNLGPSDPEKSPAQVEAQESWDPPSFGQTDETDQSRRAGQVQPEPESGDPEYSSGLQVSQSVGDGGYAINDTEEPAPPQLKLNASLPTPVTSESEPEPVHHSPANVSGTGSSTEGAVPTQDTALTDIRDSLQSIQQTLAQHRDELSRMNSLITNNEVSIQQQAEDLAALTAHVKQKPRQPPAKRADRPRLDIALISMQQMGSAQAVGVRYRGRNSRLLLGQSIDGWRLSRVLMDQGAARFTHSSSGHTITVEF